MTSFDIINPYTETITHTYNYESVSECHKKISDSHTMYQKWRDYPISHRIRIIHEIKTFLLNNKHFLAKLISTDMGKPITEAIKEIEKSAQCCDYFEKNSTAIEKRMKKKNGFHEPLGVILGIMPWNFPVWQIIRFIIPTLLAGNTCLIKPAPNTYRIANQLIYFFKNNNIPIVNNFIPTTTDCETLIGNPLISGVSFTGSVNVGKHIGSLATHHLKPCVLELGGCYLIY